MSLNKVIQALPAIVICFQNGLKAEVDTIINKLNWLKHWLNENAPQILRLKAPIAFHWVATGKVSILANSTYSRRLAKAGLTLPKSKIKLNV